MEPSTFCANSLPNVAAFTFAGVRIVSSRFWPVRATSLWCIKTLAWARARMGETAEIEIAKTAIARRLLNRVASISMLLEEKRLWTRYETRSHVEKAAKTGTLGVAKGGGPV